jgi:hypothetical protein
VESPRRSVHHKRLMLYSSISGLVHIAFHKKWVWSQF